MVDHVWKGIENGYNQHYKLGKHINVEKNVKIEVCII